jgi:hypothetical protein
LPSRSICFRPADGEDGAEIKAFLRNFVKESSPFHPESLPSIMRIIKNIIMLLVKLRTISRLARISLWLYCTAKETSDFSLNRWFPGFEKLKAGPPIPRKEYGL